MATVALRLQFEWYIPVSDRELAVQALREIGIPVEVLPEIPQPAEPEQKGGGPGFPLALDLIIQHGFNIVDGLITSGIIFGLAKALKKIKRVFGTARLRLVRDSLKDRLVVYYDISLSAYGGFEEKALLDVAKDYPRIVKELDGILRPAGAHDHFETHSIEIYRFSKAIRTGVIDPDERDPDFDPRG
jgi:hypothetical protein